MRASERVEPRANRKVEPPADELRIVAVRRGSRLLPFAIVAGLLVVASCSDGDSAARSRPSSSPLSELVGFDPLTNIWNEKLFADSLADCMHQHGFEYVPQPPLEYDREEAIAIEGYGVAAAYLDPPLIAPRPEDPNAAIIAGMSDSDREAYNRAFLGTLESTVGEELPFDKLGCNRQTQLDVYGYEGRIEGPLEQAMIDIETRARAAPPYLAAEREWSTCMGESGYDFTSSAEPQTAAIQAIEQLLGASDGGVNVATDVNQDDVRVAVESEVRLAERDFHCREESRLDEAYIEAILAAQADFVEANPQLRDQLAALRP